MNNFCKVTEKVKSLEDVSKLCSNSISCKSKYNGTDFNVTLWKNGDCKEKQEDPRTVYVRKTSMKNKVKDLDILLSDSKFFDAVKESCKGKLKSECKIIIKANFSPSSQKQYHYYTDPELVDHTVQILKKNGYTNVLVAESKTNAVLAHADLNPKNIGKNLGYKSEIHDLSDDPRTNIKFKKGGIDVSNAMLDANMIINFAKPKNHDLMHFTASLKNMYGSIPDYNKYMLFHHKESGLNVKEATVAVNFTHSADFIIADFVDSVDGDEVSYFDEPIEKFDHFQSNRLIAGRDPIIFDKYIARKMGYEDSESPIVEEAEEFAGNRILSPNLIIGDDLSPIIGWRKISGSLNLKAKMQDYIPVNDKMVAWGIRNYSFPIIEK